MFGELAPSVRSKVMALFDRANSACRAQDCRVFVIEAFRDAATQAARWAKGRSFSPQQKVWTQIGDVVTYSPRGASAHEYRLACDLALIGADGKWLAGGIAPDPRWTSILGETGEKMGLEWGGRFVVTRAGVRMPFFDGAHFQHPAWARVRDRFQRRGLPPDTTPEEVEQWLKT